MASDRRAPRLETAATQSNVQSDQLNVATVQNTASELQASPAATDATHSGQFPVVVAGGDMARHLEDLEAEKALLGAILRDNALVDRTRNLIKADDFGEPLHAAIYEAVVAARESGSLANAITLQDAFPAVDFDSSAHLFRLQKDAVGDNAVESVSTLVAERARRRRISAIAEEMVVAARAGSTYGAFTDQLREQIERLQQVSEAVGRSRKAELLDSASFVRNFTPPDYLVDRLLQRRFVYSMTGATGAGKTAIAMRLALCVGTGSSFASLKVAPGRVLYCAGENPDDVRMRWIALCDQLGIDPEGPNAPGVHFLVGNAPFSETEPSIRSQIDALGGVALVIVDTSAAFFEGTDENDNVQAAQHARRLRGLTSLPGGPAVVIACHPVKNAHPDNLIPRGGGAFVAEVDGNLTAARHGPIVELHWQGKLRGANFAPLAFKLETVEVDRLVDSSGRIIPSVVARPMTADEQVRDGRDADRGADVLLVLMLDNSNASLSDLAFAAGWMLSSGLPDRKKAQRQMLSLSQRKLVTGGQGSKWRLTKAGVAAGERVRATLGALLNEVAE